LKAKVIKEKKFNITVSLNDVKVIDGKVYVQIYIGNRNKWISYYDASNCYDVVNK